jgi:hypothetical protein
MSSEKPITRENLNEYLKELAKECRTRKLGLATNTHRNRIISRGVSSFLKLPLQRSLLRRLFLNVNRIKLNVNEIVGAKKRPGCVMIKTYRGRYASTPPWICSTRNANVSNTANIQQRAPVPRAEARHSGAALRAE